jgi:hypothetical protein
MNKQNTFLFIFLALILIGLINIKDLSIITPFESTTYSTVTSSANGVAYSSVYKNEQSGFTNIHTLSGESNEAGAYFTTGVKNKDLFKFYLEMNGISPTNFETSSRNKLSVFEPINVNFPTIYDESDGAEKEYCPQPLGDSIQLIKDLGFTWGTECAWRGNYKEDVLRSMAESMYCKVQGTTTQICYKAPLDDADRCDPKVIPYSLSGVVSYNSGNGFVCAVDKNILLNTLPKTIIDSEGIVRDVKLVGVQGDTIFTIKLTDSPDPDPQPKEPDYSNYYIVGILALITIVLYNLYISGGLNFGKR